MVVCDSNVRYDSGKCDTKHGVQYETKYGVKYEIWCITASRPPAASTESRPWFNYKGTSPSAHLIAID